MVVQKKISHGLHGKHGSEKILIRVIRVHPWPDLVQQLQPEDAFEDRAEDAVRSIRIAAVA